ncbi:hypothetical protein IWQ60_005330 [Tieghemiomyces parasiticus]|uniref:Uncharacterized protein n=1 Tax=Tieghemiomyces parasiticus TaxID=78921 RepID=A0A9W8DYZ6_9FUNG|nr:hypothetical protein IWQ60_005330 [Tieghemiomyces parasiticus]
MRIHLAFTGLLAAGTAVQASTQSQPADRPRDNDSTGLSKGYPRSIDLASLPPVRPTAGSFNACPVEIQLEIMRMTHDDTMPRFLEVSRFIRALAVTDKCISQILNKLKLTRAARYSLEYDQLTAQQKESTLETLSLEYDLNYLFYGSPEDHSILDIVAQYGHAPNAAVSAAIPPTLTEEAAMVSNYGVINFTKLTLRQKYALSPLLALAAEGDVDLVLALRDRLLNYCHSPEFMKSLLNQRTPRTADLYESARVHYNLNTVYDCPQSDFLATDIAIVNIFAIHHQLDDLDYFLNNAGYIPGSTESGSVTTSEATSNDDISDTNMTEAASMGDEGALPVEAPFQDNASAASEGENSDVDMDADANLDGNLHIDASLAILAYLLLSEMNINPRELSYFRDGPTMNRLAHPIADCASKFRATKAAQNVRDHIISLRPELIVPPDAERCIALHANHKIFTQSGGSELGFLINKNLLAQGQKLDDIPVQFFPGAGQARLENPDFALLQDALHAVGPDSITARHQALRSLDDIEREIEEEYE